MADYRVRRLGLAPCTETEYNNIKKREALVAAGDATGLKKFDEEQAAKKAAREAKAAEAAKKAETEGGKE